MTDKYLFPNTYGLVLCGGKSSRMGTDKSLQQYYDKPQRYHVYDMLLPFCENVFISCDQEQLKSMEAGYPTLPDGETFRNMGPMGALLTAFIEFPKKNILLIGCDYPFLQVNELEKFSNFCKETPATFYNQEANIYESMLGWYPYTCFEALKQMFKAREFSLQHLLRKLNALKHLPADIKSIQSIDTMEAFSQAIRQINAG